MRQLGRSGLLVSELCLGVKIPFLVPVRSGHLLGKGASPFSLVLSFLAS